MLTVRLLGQRKYVGALPVPATVHKARIVGVVHDADPDRSKLTIQLILVDELT